LVRRILIVAVCAVVVALGVAAADDFLVPSSDTDAADAILTQAWCEGAVLPAAEVPKPQFFSTVEAERCTRIPDAPVLVRAGRAPPRP
jgi:hypothetical protein